MDDVESWLHVTDSDVVSYFVISKLSTVNSILACVASLFWKQAVNESQDESKQSRERPTSPHAPASSFRLLFVGKAWPRRLTPFLFEC